MTTYIKAPAVKIILHEGFRNANPLFRAASDAHLGLPAACALIEKESHGHNVYGNDAGGALAGYPYPVNQGNYKVFRWLISKGQKSNGVGPAQITSPALLDDMVKKRLAPWAPYDNMLYGFILLEQYFQIKHSWRYAGLRYNGSAVYGDDLANKVIKWQALLKPAVR